MKTVHHYTLLLGLAGLLAGPVPAAASPADTPSVAAERIAAPIVIDGNLIEDAWKRPAINGPFKTMFPSFGEPMPQETRVWAAYDGDSLYFAFHCLDPEPQGIKTSISRRDSIDSDDRIGVILDADSGRQRGYEFYVNPDGIQQDAVSSAVRVTGADKSQDFVWESAGRRTADGYQVEIRIPLKSVRYQAGSEVRMGLLCFRQISRSGIKATWPAIEPGGTYFPFMASVSYRDLRAALRWEILPAVTFNREETRNDAGGWAAETRPDFGLSLKYGLSSAMSAEATVNPDFSQVESDAYQVEVNQRYPVFYAEKRPFFMESADIFDFGVVSWGFMTTPVHTRMIANPDWALKFSGTTKRWSFALLAADDRAANAAGSASALFGVFRAKVAFSGDNTVGILYSGRRLDGGANDAAGADMKFQVAPNVRATLSFLSTRTTGDPGGPGGRGTGLNAMVHYRTPSAFAMAGYERYDPGFAMSTAFIQRTGIGRLILGAGATINTRLKPLPWLKCLQPYGYWMGLHDLTTKMDDTTRLLGVVFNLAPMGEVNIEHYWEGESWAGRLFRKRYWNLLGQTQLFRWLRLNGGLILGDGIYYDPAAPFLGDMAYVTAGFLLQPSAKIHFGADYIYTHLRPESGGKAVYVLDIVNIVASYQANKYFMLRGILRYNGFESRLLTDFLASLTLVPGTVVHLGYGTLYLKESLSGGALPSDLLRPAKRGLFFKASYLWRI